MSINDRKAVCNDIAKTVAGHEFIKALPEKGLSKVEFRLFQSFFVVL